MDLYAVSFRTLVLVCCLWCVELVLEEDEEGDTDRGQTQTRSSSDLKRNYYQTLGVQQTATDKEVRRAFRKLAMKHHPDKNKSPDAENTFREMAEAYGVLSNKEKRSLYDHLGHEAFVRSEEESGGGAPPEDHQDFFSFHQMFDHMFVFDQEEGEWEGEEPFVGAGHWSTEGPGQHWSFPPTGGEDFWGSEFIDQGHHYREEQQFCWLHPQADGSTITICEGG